MAISLTLHSCSTILISLMLIIQTKSIPDNEIGYVYPKLTLASRFDNLWTTQTEVIVSHVTHIPNPAAFLANISIGNPPVSQLLLVDTGSDLTWIQCLPHPSRSSTYRNASCEPAPHAMPRIFRDQKTGTCRYYLRYRDRSSTRGLLAEETFAFQTSENGLISKPDIVFGCGQENSGFTRYSGVLGLGPGKFSIVERNFGSKFSYSFGSLTDPTYSQNVLILGDGAKTEGEPTPLEIFQDRYYLDLQAISLGDKFLDIEPGLFKRYGSQGGTVIDTGCSTTILAREAYETVSDEIDSLLGEVLSRVEDGENLCYKGNMKLIDLIGFPLLTFHFADGAKLALDAESLFVSSESGDSFCLAMSMNSFDYMSVIGAMAQQNYNVGYDLGAMKVYFQRTNSELKHVSYK